jgi:hypothetical protein
LLKIPSIEITADGYRSRKETEKGCCWRQDICRRQPTHCLLGARNQQYYISTK